MTDRPAVSRRREDRGAWGKKCYKTVRPQEGVISLRLCPVFALETSLTVFRGNSRPSPVLLTHTHLCSLLRGAGSGWGRWGQEQVGHLTERDPAPDSLEEQDVAREGQALCSSTGSPPHWLWCCPCSAHRGQSRLRGRAGQARGVPERVAGGWSCLCPPSSPSHQLLAQGAHSTEAT